MQRRLYSNQKPAWHIWLSNTFLIHSPGIPSLHTWVGLWLWLGTAHLYQTTSWNLPHWNVLLAVTASWHDMTNFRVEQHLQRSPMGQETVLPHCWKLNDVRRLLCKALSQTLLCHRSTPVGQGTAVQKAWAQRGSTKRNTKSEIVPMLPICKSPGSHSADGD